MTFDQGRGGPAEPGGGAAPGGGVDKRQATRLAVTGLILLVAALFVVQNNDRVETTFLVFSVETRLWVGLVVALLLGAILGQAVEAIWHRRHRRDD